jgi:hypothetical protein
MKLQYPNLLQSTDKWRSVVLVQKTGYANLPGHINSYAIGVCCFSAKHQALRGNSKDWLSIR